MYDLLFFCQNLSSSEKNGADKDHTPENRKTAARATFVFRSTQAPLRHIGKHPLMLLGSPPDMVRESRLRKTRVSTRKNKKQDRTKISLRTGIHPCCSGLQVQGSAMSPVSVTFVRAVLKELKKDRIYYNTKREKNQGKKQNSRLFHAFRAFCEKAGGKRSAARENIFLFCSHSSVTITTAFLSPKRSAMSRCAERVQTR